MTSSDGVSYDFITDRLAVGNVASRAVPGFVAVVSLLSTAPWDELTGAPKIPGNLKYPVHAGAIRADTCGRDGIDLGSKSDAVMWWHVDIGDGETRRVHPGNGETYGCDLEDHLDSVTAFIAAHIARGCVLVHCGAGKSRSVAVVVAYLCRYAGMSYSEALALVKLRRPCAAPCDAFAEAVKRWLRLDDLATAGPRR